MSYAWQQLQCAVKALAGNSEQRDRLVTAYNKLVKLKPKDLPAEVAADFDRLVGSIPRYPAKNIPREVKTEVLSLSDTQVSQAIAVISAMHEAVAVYQPRRLHLASARSRVKAEQPAQCTEYPAYRVAAGWASRHWKPGRAGSRAKHAVLPTPLAFPAKDLASHVS